MCTLLALCHCRYHEIESQSGVKFFHEVGHLSVGLPHSSGMQLRQKNAGDHGIEHDRLSSPDMKRMFPFLVFPTDCVGLFEAHDAGWISARGLVQAQTLAAKKAGCTMVDEHVQFVGAPSAPGSPLLIRTALGKELQANKVLVSAGGFTNFKSLLPSETPGQHIKLDVDLLTAQIVKVQLGESDQERLRGMPSVIYSGKRYWCYILPPAQYPDGKWYIKLGGGLFGEFKEVGGKKPVFPGLPGKRILETHQEVVEWYRCGGEPEAEAQMLEMLNDIVPGLTPLSVHSESCATTHTPTGQAYCGMVGPSGNVGVLVGGNGLAAKSSDELGRLAALCILSKNGWACTDYQADQFEPRTLPFKLNKEERANLLSRSWDEAASGYDAYFGPRFMPWARDTLGHLVERESQMPSGPILAAACGPGRELVLLAEQFSKRAIIGVDLSPGMVKAAETRIHEAKCSERVTVQVGDATNIPSVQGGYAAIYSIFGLQQFHMPLVAISNWCQSLAPGGLIGLCYWPGFDSGQEGDPWTEMGRILKRWLGSSRASKATSDWEEQLEQTCGQSGVHILVDNIVAHEIVHESFDDLWKAMTEDGPYRPLKIRRGDDFLLSVKKELMSKCSEVGPPIRHAPKARLLVMRKGLESHL